MRIITLLILLILTGCVDRTTEESIDKLSLQEIEQRINGAWKLKTVQTDEGILELDSNSNEIKYFDFHGFKGVEAQLIENHDGTYGTNSGDPLCELKERDNKKIIEYSLIFSDNWEKEIKSLSGKKLVLADSLRTWTYIRTQLNDVE